jgi:disulfide bond formation protein DsbB
MQIQPERSAGRSERWAVGSLLVAAAGTAGSLWLSLGMGLKACPLCFYQRSFVMAVLATLVVGLVVDRARSGLLCLLSVAPACAGLGVAAFHVYLELAEVLECPRALLGLGSAPMQSFAMFVVLVLTTASGAWSGRSTTRPGSVALLGALLGAALLGGALALACVRSAPPLPPAPTAAYDPVKQPLDTCRRVFRNG